MGMGVFGGFIAPAQPVTGIRGLPQFIALGAAGTMDM